MYELRVDERPPDLQSGFQGEFMSPLESHASLELFSQAFQLTQVWSYGAAVVDYYTEVLVLFDLWNASD